MKKIPARLVAQAEKLAQSAESWADLSNALFDPMHGLLTQTYPDRAERTAFMKTAQYKKIRKLLSDSMDQHGLVEGATPSKSGRFVVRVPRSMHAALEREAELEGVSLNQLIVAKLALQLRSMTEVRAGTG